jgi:cell division protein FtsL
MKFVLVAAFLLSLGSLCALTQSNPTQNPPRNSGQKTASNTVEPPAPERTPPKDQFSKAMQAPVEKQTPGAATPREGADESLKTMISMLSVLVAVLSLAVSASTAVYVYRKNYQLNTTIAERTVTIEAQKLLLEINKQFISDPDLFAIYDDNPGRRELLNSKPQYVEKLKALGYMNLNVFEIVFTVLGRGTSRKTWDAYFEDTIRRCSILQEELNKNTAIYHPELIAAYRSWQSSHGGRTGQTHPSPVPPPAIATPQPETTSPSPSTQLPPSADQSSSATSPASPPSS